MTTTTFNFKLYLAPGALEKFTVNASNIQNLLEILEAKIGDLGLNFDVIYCRNPKGNLVSLGEKPQKLEKFLKKSGNSVSLYAIPESDSDSSSDSSSGEDSDGEDDEIVIVEEVGTPDEEPRRRGGRCAGRRGGLGGCKRFGRGFGFGRRHHMMKHCLFGKRRHCLGGRRSRSAPPSGPEDIRRRMCGRRRHDSAGERPEGFGRRHFPHGPFGPFGRFGPRCGRTEFPEGGRRHCFFGRRGPFGPEEARPEGFRKRHCTREENGPFGGEGPEGFRRSHCGPPPAGPEGFPPHEFGGFGGHHGFGEHRGFRGHHGFGHHGFGGRGFGHHGFGGHGFGGHHGFEHRHHSFGGHHGFGGPRGGFGGGRHHGFGGHRGGFGGGFEGFGPC